METLGFFDTPSTSSSGSRWLPPTPAAITTTAQPTGHTVQDLWESTELSAETLVDWNPSSTNRSLHKRNLRWGVILMVALIVGGIAAGAYWTYQRSATAAVAATSELVERANDLDLALRQLQPLANHLGTAESATGEDTSTLIIAVNQAARDLFSSSADLSPSEGSSRSIAADAASLALDATQRINDVTAYRLALLPNLTPPALETDSSLVDLTAAAQDFGDWRARLMDVREALPIGVATETTGQFDQLLGSLEGLQREYLDALRSETRFAAANLLADVEDDLVSINSLLDAEITESGIRAFAQIEDARAKLGLLVG
jgi:hypothetical protein